MLHATCLHVVYCVLWTEAVALALPFSGWYINKYIVHLTNEHIQVQVRACACVCVRMCTMYVHVQRESYCSESLTLRACSLAHENVHIVDYVV